MIKKRAIVFFLLFALIGMQASNVIAATDTSFFNTNKQEINPGETLEMTLDISKVQYDKFEFKLSSNLDTNNIVINENIETEKYNNDISIKIDKEKINLEKITFHYKVPENAQVGTTIELVAQIIAAESEQTEDTENTITTEVQNNIVDSKTIIVNIVETKQADKPENPNEQTNNEKPNMPNEQENPGMSVNTEKQDFNLSNNESKKTSGNVSMNLSTNLVMSSIKAQTTTITTSAINFSGTSATPAETAVYNGSNNNYLTNLEIEGETLNTTFNKEKPTYFVETTGKTELTVNFEKEDDASKVYITGNENLKTGDNKILISVTAENGNVRFYRIFVTNK